MLKRFSLIYKSGICCLLMGVFILTSCGGNEEQNDTDTTEEAPKTEDELAWEKALEETEDVVPLDQKLDELYKAIEETEGLAFQSEMVKINDSQSLISEVEQSLQKYDRNTLDSIKGFLKDMEATLYTEETMSNLEQVEAYDANTLLLTEGWKRFRADNPEFEKHARAKAFFNSIMEADKKDQQIRSNYNLYVHDYNELLTNKVEEIKALGEKYQGLEPYPFFYGEDPVLM